MTTLQSFKFISLRPRSFHLKTRNLSLQNNNLKFNIKNGSSFLVKFLEDNNPSNEISDPPWFQSTKQGFSSCCTNTNQLLQTESNQSNPLATDLQTKTKEVSRNFGPIKLSSFPCSKANYAFLALSYPRPQEQQSLHSYDPVYLFVKPFTPTSDDILCVKDNEDDEDVICRKNYRVTVLSNPMYYPPGLFEPTFKYTPLTDFEKNMIDMAGTNAQTVRTQSTDAPGGFDRTPSVGKPKPEQVEHVYMSLSNSLPRFFTQPHDYSIYAQDVEFNNNIRGVSTRGLAAYVQQLALVRIVGHLKFAHVRFDVLKITKHPDDGTIRVRWRIRGISAMKVFMKIWKIRFWDWKKLLDNEADWYDGFSIFYLGEDGLVHRHDCDKMVPDDEMLETETTQSLAAKLALLLGVLQRPALDDLNTVMMALLKMDGGPSANQSIVK